MKTAKIELDSKKYYRPQVKSTKLFCLSPCDSKSLTIHELSSFIFKNVNVGLNELPIVLIQNVNYVSILVLQDKSTYKVL